VIALETCYFVIYTKKLVLLNFESVWAKGFLKYTLMLMVSATCRAVLFVNVRCANVQNEATCSFQEGVSSIYSQIICAY
jgi:hypothetical protein